MHSTHTGGITRQISDNNGIHMTFDEIRASAIRVAQNLQTRGYGPKQVFGLVARNNHLVAPLLFASLAIGCPVNGIDPSFRKAEFIHMLSITKPVLIFCDVTCEELLSECLTEIGIRAKIFTFGGHQGQSEPIENLFKETHIEHEFM